LNKLIRAIKGSEINIVYIGNEKKKLKLALSVISIIGISIAKTEL